MALVPDGLSRLLLDDDGSCGGGCRRGSLWGLILAALVLFSVEAAAGQGNAPGHVVVASGSTVRALRLTDQVELWSTDAGMAVTHVQIVPDGERSIVLARGDQQTVALDGQNGQILWTRPGWPSHMAQDVYGRLFTNPLSFPHGPPNLGGGPAPDLLLLLPQPASPRTTHLVDSRSGELIWSRTEPTDTRGFMFLITPEDTYDVVFASESSNMLRVTGADGASVVWQRSIQRTWGIPIPDVTGDGQADLLTGPSYFSSIVRVMDGATGLDVWSKPYGSFDLIGVPQVLPGQNGDDVIVSAQGSSAGGVRRYRAADGEVIWTCPSAYNNNTLMGILQRTDGLTILSGWRHRGRAVAIDAATGWVMWDSVPAGNSDFVGIGVPDLTADGSDDFLALHEGLLKLYDGVTGQEQTWFPPIAASRVAYDPALTDGEPQPCNAPFADMDGDGDVDMDDFAFFQRCYTGPGGADFDYHNCHCLDRNRDGAIDLLDWEAFLNCYGGPTVPADPNCEIQP